MLGIAETFQSVSGATRGAAESARREHSIHDLTKKLLGGAA